MDQKRKSNILEHKIIAMEEETGARQHLLLCGLNSRLTNNQTHSVSLQNVHPEFSKGVDACVPQLQYSYITNRKITSVPFGQIVSLFDGMLKLLTLCHKHIMAGLTIQPK